MEDRIVVSEGSGIGAFICVEKTQGFRCAFPSYVAVLADYMQRSLRDTTDNVYEQHAATTDFVFDDTCVDIGICDFQMRNLPPRDVT